MKNSYSYSILGLQVAPIANNHPLAATPDSVEGFDDRGDFYLFEFLSRLAMRIDVQLQFTPESRRKSYTARFFATLYDCNTDKPVTSKTITVSGVRDEGKLLIYHPVRVDMPLRANQIDITHDYSLVLIHPESDFPICRKPIKFYPVRTDQGLLQRQLFTPKEGALTIEENDVKKECSAIELGRLDFSTKIELKLKVHDDFVDRFPKITYALGTKHHLTDVYKPESVEWCEGEPGVLKVVIHPAKYDEPTKWVIANNDYVALTVQLYTLGHPFGAVTFRVNAPELRDGHLDQEDMTRLTYEPWDVKEDLDKREKKWETSDRKTRFEAKKKTLESHLLNDGFMAELNQLVGLSAIKERFIATGRLVSLNLMREQAGLPVFSQPLHALFLGQPGTGKTTVAKMMGRLYHACGLLSKGHVVVKDRASLLGQYIGETEKHIREAIEEAEGGVLFIDEAYQLLVTKSDNDFGRHVMDALMTLLADPDRRDIMVILAGYEEPMRRLIATNPGLASRFPEAQRFIFPAMSVESLVEVARRYCDRYKLSLSQDAEQKLWDHISAVAADADDTFGNARYVINLFETCVVYAMASRLSCLDSPSPERLSLIEAADIPEPRSSKPRILRIGFAS